jgi:hypothetical protein
VKYPLAGHLHRQKCEYGEYENMTDATHRRALAAARGRKHRALRKQGKAAYCVKAHEQRLAEALIKSGMPHHGSRHHQRRVRCWLRQARRPDRGSGDVDQRGSAVAPQALPAVGGNAQKRGRTSIPPRRRSGADLICACKKFKMRATVTKRVLFCNFDL